MRATSHCECRGRDHAIATRTYTGEAAIARRAHSVAALLAVLLAAPVKADPAEDFYRGKTINLYIGTTSGGGYDLYARLVAVTWALTFPAIRRSCHATCRAPAVARP